MAKLLVRHVDAAIWIQQRLTYVIIALAMWIDPMQATGAMPCNIVCRMQGLERAAENGSMRQAAEAGTSRGHEGGEGQQDGKVYVVSTL